tara:strand:+ start:3756 stop:4127 length:372 start_codon:yes stop_codon:yes gene_type:complete
MATTIRFWNGNKSDSRQNYERLVLETALASTEFDYGPFQLQTDCTDYPTVEGEADVFRSKNYDVFATVSGNPKLKDEKKIVIDIPLMKGLLGYRLLIIRKEDIDRFSNISSEQQIQNLTVGIP